MVARRTGTVLVVDTGTTGEVFDESRPEVLPRRPQLHFDTPAAVTSVNVNGPVSRRTRIRDVVEDAIGFTVSPFAVGREPTTDPCDCLEGWQDDATSADVLHTRKLHPRFSAKLVGNGVAPLEALGDLDSAFGFVPLADDAGAETPTCCLQREPMLRAKRLNHSDSRPEVVELGPTFTVRQVVADRAPSAIHLAVGKTRRFGHGFAGYVPVLAAGRYCHESA